MFKLIAAWSAPKPADLEAFEKHYLEVHAPLAKAVPELRRIVLTRTDVGLEGAAPAFHRIAEMSFDDPAALERSAHSSQWKALREDAGVMINQFGVNLDVGMGNEVASSFGGGFDLGDVDRLLATTRAVRKRLDLERPVPREVLLECLRLSQQAPTGSNRQGWRWMVVTDLAKRTALADIYRRGGAEYLEQALKATPAGDAQTRRVYESALWLVDNLAKVPVHVIPCIQGRLPDAGVPEGMRAGFYGSIFPAVWSFQLALRSRGLGSVLTTLHANREREAADLLGIPFAQYTQVALLPVAWTKGMDFKPAERPPVESIVSFDRWSN
jgi:uncharacterized protein (TIGR02118 family)